MVTLPSPKRGQASEQRQHDSLSPRRPYPRYVGEVLTHSDNRWACRPSYYFSELDSDVDT
jgi:hypothetical protein